jgi:hypothetical protein
MRYVKLGTPQLPLLPAGDYLLKTVVLAPDGAPSSADGSLPVAVIGATVDLAAADLQPMYGADAPRRIEKVRLTVTNLGNIPMRGPVDVEFVASIDAAPGGGDDVVVARVPVALNLAPGRSKTLSLSLAYPPQLPPGFYTLIARLDPQGLLGQAEPALANDVVIGRRSIRAG